MSQGNIKLGRKLLIECGYRYCHLDLMKLLEDMQTEGNHDPRTMLEIIDRMRHFENMREVSDWELPEEVTGP